VRCPVGVSASGLVIEVRVCGNDSIGIGKAMLWQVWCNMSRSRSNGKAIMIVRCPFRCLGIVRRDRSCMLEQWATIQRVTGTHSEPRPSYDRHHARCAPEMGASRVAPPSPQSHPCSGRPGNTKMMQDTAGVHGQRHRQPPHSTAPRTRQRAYRRRVPQSNDRNRMHMEIQVHLLAVYLCF
jgi:hypothetical protein